MSKRNVREVVEKLRRGQYTDKIDAGVLQMAGFDNHWALRRIASGKATASDANIVTEWYNYCYS